MTVRLQLMVPALTPSGRHGLVGAGDNLDKHGREAAARQARRWPSTVVASCAPERACIETAALVGMDAVVDLKVRDWDLGAWTGRSLEEIASTSPEEIEQWSTDPDFAAHGGESLNQLGVRVTDWLNLIEAERQARLVTVAPTAVVRAILVSVLSAPPTTFWHLDLEPLTSVQISLRPGRRAVRWSTCDAHAQQSSPRQASSH